MSLQDKISNLVGELFPIDISNDGQSDPEATHELLGSPPHVRVWLCRSKALAELIFNRTLPAFVCAWRKVIIAGCIFGPTSPLSGHSVLTLECVETAATGSLHLSMSNP
jgi:hypothetical protein